MAAKSMSFSKYGSFSETQEVKTTSPSISRHASFDTDQVSKDFVDFLKNLQKPGREIYKQCRAFIVNMSSKKVCWTQNSVDALKSRNLYVIGLLLNGHVTWACFSKASKGQDDNKIDIRNFVKLKRVKLL